MVKRYFGWIFEAFPCCTFPFTTNSCGL